MYRWSYIIINGITWYRVVTAPVLIVLVFLEQIDIFKWLLAASFFTDLIDGTLARKFKTTSIFGSRLDSIGDDLTVLAAVTGLFVFKLDFIRDERVIFIFLLAAFVIQTVIALIRYGRVTSFHTYLAKAAAILQGLFFILVFLMKDPVYFLFYAAAAITFIELIEEIILVLYLPKWKANVKGIYWVMNKK